jgi:hypothetical protein
LVLFIDLCYDAPVVVESVKMDDRFKVFVDRLEHGHIQEIDETIPPSLLDLSSEDALFKHEIRVKGSAYLANHELIVALEVKASVEVPCRICGDECDIPLALAHLYLTPTKEEIKGGIYSFREALRDELLLEVPRFHECHGGKCPSRKEIDKYLKKQEAKGKEETQQPFKDLL